MSRKYVASSPAATADSPPPRTPPTHAATPPAPESRRPIIVKARDIDPFRKAIIRMRDRHDGVNNSHCKLTAKELTQILRDHPAGDSDVRGRIEHLARRNEELEGAVADLEKELKAALELLGYAEQRASVRAH